MNDALAFLIGLIVGAAGGAVATWATCRPIARIEAILDRAETLFRNVDSDRA